MNEHTPTLYTVSHLAWQAMLHDIRTARVSIDLEQYIFEPTDIGADFIVALKQKAKEGVKIRILADMVGSVYLYRSTIPEELRQLGIEIAFYNPIFIWRLKNFTSHFFRNHRKTLVIDGVIAHVGGVGIGQHMATWRDTHVRYIGTMAKEITHTFDALWQNTRKSFQRKNIFPKNNQQYYVITNGPGVGTAHIYRELIQKIRGAQKYIYLTTPYFIPTARLMRELKRAARRGVDVRMMMPGVIEYRFIDRASESHYTPLLEAGVKIYKYHTAYVHAKVNVVDDVWASAGSYNLDNLSRYFNHEINVSSVDPFFIHHVKSDFHNDMSHAHEITLNEWRQRPLLHKLMELLTWPFQDLM
jgi:cardiolipin synthase